MRMNLHNFIPLFLMRINLFCSMKTDRINLNNPGCLPDQLTAILPYNEHNITAIAQKNTIYNYNCLISIYKPFHFLHFMNYSLSIHPSIYLCILRADVLIPLTVVPSHNIVIVLLTIILVA